MVTHAFHPLYRREFALVDRYLAWGEDRVCFHDDEGGLRYLPTAWTSMAPPDPFVQTSAGRSHLRIENLLQLTTLIAGQPQAKRPRPRRRYATGPYRGPLRRRACPTALSGASSIS
ncbi:MAG TPA: DUF5372 family protein [Xanthobacteraceae bacterium]|nr:DUF5372 family protein [Xanthobacteraceae bacterium]